MKTVDVDTLYSHISVITDRKGRQCFQKRVSFCSQGGWLPSMHHKSHDQHPGGGFPAYITGHMTRGSESRGKGVCIQGEGVYIQRKEGLYTGGFEQIPMVVTSSCSNCSSQYGSYWNAFLFPSLFAPYDASKWAIPCFPKLNLSRT